ncbi:MAG: hypothetical protein IPG56_04775 [Caulobacteraceae bacterium]|nr:hypothetical protein [Caulobacteraceae bacterium]
MRKFFVAAASLVALAACGQTTTPATTTETPAEVAATTTGPTNAADATAQTRAARLHSNRWLVSRQRAISG